MNEKGGGGGFLHTNLITCYLAKRHLNIFHISPFPSMWREGGGRIVLHQIVVKEGRTPAFHLLPAGGGITFDFWLNITVIVPYHETLHT